jgi:hypothetical protein
LHLALFVLRKRHKGSGSCCSHLRNLISQHLAQGWDGIGIDAKLFSDSIVTNRSQVKSSQLSYFSVRRLQVFVQSGNSI